MRRRISNPYYRKLKQVRRIQHSIKQDRSILVVKIFIPMEVFPDFNFMGKLLGPKGKILKHLEATTNCKILIRGKGSYRNKPRDLNRFHNEEDLHVLITAEGTHDTVVTTMDQAICKIRPYLEPDMDEKEYTIAVRSYEKAQRLKSTAAHTKISTTNGVEVKTPKTYIKHKDRGPNSNKTNQNWIKPPVTAVPNESRKIPPPRNHSRLSRPHFNPYVVDPNNVAPVAQNINKNDNNNNGRDFSRAKVMERNQSPRKYSSFNTNPPLVEHRQYNDNMYNNQYSSQRFERNERYSDQQTPTPHYNPAPTNNYNYDRVQEYSNVQYDHNIPLHHQPPPNYQPQPQRGHINPQNFYYDYNNVPPNVEQYNNHHYSSSNNVPIQHNNLNMDRVNDATMYHQSYPRNFYNESEPLNYYPNNNLPAAYAKGDSYQRTRRFHASQNEAAQYHYRS